MISSRQESGQALTRGLKQEECPWAESNIRLSINSPRKPIHRAGRELLGSAGSSLSWVMEYTLEKYPEFPRLHVVHWAGCELP
jgi:hypothetical protein